MYIDTGKATVNRSDEKQVGTSFFYGAASVSPYTSADAWEAYYQGDLAAAERIWLALLLQAQNTETFCRYQFAYSYVLIAQRRYQEAVSLLEELYEITGASVYVHRLGHVALAQGKLDLARTHFMAEQACLPAHRYESQGLNMYSMGLLTLFEAKLSLVRHYAECSRDYAERAKDPVLRSCAEELLAQRLELLMSPNLVPACEDAAVKAITGSELQEIELRLAGFLILH